MASLSTTKDPLSRTETTHLKGVGIDVDRVGEVVGTGAQYRVRHLYQQGRDEIHRVVKMRRVDVERSLYAATIGKLFAQTRDRAERELIVCKRHFEPYVPPTEVVPFRNPMVSAAHEEGLAPLTADEQAAVAAEEAERFCLLQDFVEGIRITPAIIRERSGVRRQMEDILDRNRAMMDEEAQWLDIVGFHPGRSTAFLLLGKAYADNVLLEPETDRVFIIDTGTFPVPTRNPGTWPYAIPFWFQRANMEKFDLRY